MSPVVILLALALALSLVLALSWVFRIVRSPVFVTTAQFGDALDSVSSRSYFRNMGAMDLVARRCDSCDYSKRVLDALVGPDDHQARTLVTHAHEADRRCRRHTVPALRALPSIPWRFAVLSDDVEGGMPHTHHDVVCIPRAILSGGDWLVRLLIHEKLHVLQKTRPGLCAASLADAGWVKVGRRSDVDGRLLSRARSNPDTDGFIYRRTGHCPTLAVFGADRLTDTERVCAWDREQPTAGPGPDVFEHPFEMIAYSLSELAVPTHPS